MERRVQYHNSVMNFSWFRTVLKPPISRLLPGYFLYVIFLLLTACTASDEGKRKPAQTEINDGPKIAKTVPPVYINAADKKFTNHQDTVFYDGHFFTGYRFALYPNGDTAALQSYFNGVEEGLQKKWYPNKQSAEERFYINGKKEGTHKGWWVDGKPKFLFTLWGDEYEGEFKEWDAAGLLIKQFHYHKGHEEGSQRLWWADGSVRANYVIKNGRKYGLIGIKLCNNPYDSVYKK